MCAVTFYSIEIHHTIIATEATAIENALGQWILYRKIKKNMHAVWIYGTGPLIILTFQIKLCFDPIYMDKTEQFHTSCTGQI